MAFIVDYSTTILVVLMAIAVFVARSNGQSVIDRDDGDDAGITHDLSAISLDLAWVAITSSLASSSSTCLRRSPAFKISTTAPPPEIFLPHRNYLASRGGGGIVSPERSSLYNEHRRAPSSNPGTMVLGRRLDNGR